MAAAPDPSGPNADQIEFWNGEPGQRWVQYQQALDAQIGALGGLALDRLAPTPGERILDSGCGCGQTTLELARRVAPGGNVTGADISAVMLAHGRRRAAEAGLGNVDFITADAQTHAFAPAAFDAVFSRFGVMFFAVPEAAFANLHRALRPGGRMVFACWQALTENPWAALPLKAISGIVEVPAADPTAPGPFSLADPDRVHRILGAAGFVDIAHRGVRQPIAIGGEGDFDRIIDLILNLGPTARLLREADDATRERGTEAVAAALRPYYRDRRVMLDGAIWIFSGGKEGRN